MDRITAEELIYHLNRRYGKGTFRDSEGAEIVSDPDNCLQPGVYFFTIDEDKASDSPGAWQATQPNQRHLILRHAGLGKLRFVTSAAIDLL